MSNERIRFKGTMLPGFQGDDVAINCESPLEVFVDGSLAGTITPHGISWRFNSTFRRFKSIDDEVFVWLRQITDTILSIIESDDREAA